MRRAALSAAVALSLSALAGCGRDAPVQSDLRPLGLDTYGPVQTGGSDIKSWFFMRDWLPEMILTASGKFNAASVAAKFSELLLDPAKLQLTESARVRVYFVGEHSGYLNALGVNTEGVDAKSGAPKIVFPNKDTSVGLYEYPARIDKAEKRLDPEKMGKRSTDNPVLPGDFVDLGKLKAGTRLGFFLVADDHSGAVNVYTTEPGANPDGAPHVVAVAVPESPYLLLSFEDMYGGGDKDFSDCVFAVEMSSYNIQALLGKIDPWRRTKQIALIATIFILVFFGPGAYLGMRQYIKIKRFNQTCEEAQDLLKGNDAAQVLRIVQAAKKRDRNRERRRILTGFEVAANEQLRDLEGLLSIYEDSPEAFQEREQASLKVGRAQIEADDFSEFAALRESWRGHEQDEYLWYNLETDLLIRQDKRREALTLLKSKDFYGSQDAGRLARIGMLLSRRSPEKAQAYLQRARRLDNREPDVHLCEARACEYQGDINGALASYKAALVCRPYDPFLRDALAEYQRRIGRLHDALVTWAEGMKPPSMDFIWLKALFWERVAEPFPASWKSLEPPHGAAAPLIHYLMALPPGQLWDAAAFEPIAQQNPKLQSRQEVFWLTVINALRNAHEDEALSLLNLKRFGERSWQEDLEIALLRISTFRRLGFMDPALVRQKSRRPQVAKRHPLFQTLDRWTAGELDDGPPALKILLRSEDAYAAAFLAAGWYAAGLSMRTTSALLSGMPDWLTRDIIEAQRIVREHELPSGKIPIPLD